MHIFEVLLKPVVTEKSTSLQEKGKYVFQVDTRANKAQVKESVEKGFNVTVLAVNMMRVRGKRKRFGRGITTAPSWKKSIVTLKPGDKIQLFEGT